MAKRLAVLEAANQEAHAHRYKVQEQREKIQEMRQETVVVREEVQTGHADVDNLLEAIDRKDKELAEQDARIETLLAFVPEKDVAMIFDGTAKGPKIHDLGGDDLDEVAAGTRSPRHCDRPVVVARFPRRAPVPAELSELDIRRARRAGVVGGTAGGGGAPSRAGRGRSRRG